MGLFAGKRPQGLGLHQGKFKPCSWKPNCVNSMTDAKADPGHAIAPFKPKGDVHAAWAALVKLLSGRPRVTLVTHEKDYLYAEFKSAGMGYVDDVEFHLDDAGGLIHVRSASRLGIRDFGVNRSRVEALRGELGMG